MPANALQPTGVSRLPHRLLDAAETNPAPSGRTFWEVVDCKDQAPAPTPPMGARGGQQVREDAKAVARRGEWASLSHEQAAALPPLRMPFNANYGDWRKCTDPRVRNHCVVFGGSFNPPHWGTVGVCLALLQGGAAQVVLMPAYRHAEKTDLAPFKRRFAMCVAVARWLKEHTRLESDRVLVSKAEEQCQADGQTLPVLEHLAARRPTYPISVVLGSDLAQSAPTWPQWDTLCKKFPVVFVPRPGYSQGADFDLHGVALAKVSSTAIRLALSAKPLSELSHREQLSASMPAEVLSIVEKYGLYQPAHRAKPPEEQALGEPCGPALSEADRLLRRPLTKSPESVSFDETAGKQTI